MRGRIRHDFDWMGHGEYIVFETTHDDGDGWGTDHAYKVVDGMINADAVRLIKRWQALEIGFYINT